MELDKKSILLATNCNNNIKSFSKKETILPYLPIENEKFKIFFETNKLIFTYKGKVSYIYLKDGYFSNLEIMKRLGYILGIELKQEDIFSITKFCLEINNILAKEVI